MAEKDSITKKYMQNNAVFADVFNFYLYDGEQVIKPEQLKPLDTAAIVLPYGKNAKSNPVQKFRDVIKIMTAKEDDNAAYLLLGIENQSEIHYAMPVRNMLYDAIQYSGQTDEISKSHKKNADKAGTNAEFLSGFYRTDKLVPVITLVIYFGAEKWNAPMTLHEMLSLKEERLLKYIPDYRINLIAPEAIADNDFDKFHTDMNLIFQSIKYSRDKKKMTEILNENPAYKKLSRETTEMISITTNTGMKMEKGEEFYDMCKAFADMKEEGREEGIREERIRLAEKMLKRGMTVEEISEDTELSVEEVRAISEGKIINE